MCSGFCQMVNGCLTAGSDCIASPTKRFAALLSSLEKKKKKKSGVCQSEQQDCCLAVQSASTAWCLALKHVGIQSCDTGGAGTLQQEDRQC